MFNNQGNSKPEASQKENGDMASEWEELVELDDVQLATIVGGGKWGGGFWDYGFWDVRMWEFGVNPGWEMYVGWD